MASPKSSNNSINEWREGWGVVLSAAVGVAIAGLIYHFVGTMIKPFEAAFGWSRAEVAFGVTIMSLLNPVANIMSGKLVDRYGPRPIALKGAFLYCIAMCSLGLAGPQLWTWYLACVCFAFLTLFVSSVVWTSLVVKRFNRQRGLALAMSLMGGGIMVAITPILVVFLLEKVGVRGVFFAIGLGGGIIMLTLTYLLFHDKPTHPHTKIPTPNLKAIPQAHGLSLRDSIRTRPFWQLSSALLLVAGCVGTFMIHIQPILTDSGLTPAVAASVAFFMGPSMIAGRLITGVAFDIFDSRIVSSVAFGLPIIACALLLQLDGGYLMAVAAGIFIGLSMGAEIDVVAYLTSRYFGLRHYGILFAILISIYQVGSGSGSAISAAVYDSSQSYNSILYILAFSCVIAIFLVATMGKPPNRQH